MFNKRWKSAWLGGVLIVLLTLLAYLPALRSGFIWDDDDYVTENVTLHDLNGLKRIWMEVGAVPQYYPLVHTSFWIEYHLWGLNAFGYHLVNVLLHAVAAILLWRVLSRLMLPGGWLAAGIFALHPVGVESVAWITERKNVLSAVFYFSAALAYLRHTQKSEILPQGGTKSENLWKWYFLSLGLFVCALFSKTVACSLPAALLLVCWWKKGRLRMGDVWPTLPFFAIGAGLGWLTTHTEKHTVGAVGAEWALSFLERSLIAGRALWFYAGKLVWPANLTFIYPRWEINTAVWWQWLFPAGALVVVAVLWLLRRRIGRGPLVAALFFAGTLFPALGFFNVYPMRFSFVADHFQYLASAGLIALVSAGLARVSRRAIVLLLLALGVLTWQQTHIYRDLETLWLDTLSKNPACWLAHNNLGQLLKKRGLVREEEAYYRAALRFKPDYADALSNMGSIVFDRGRVEEALEYFEKALKSEPHHPGALISVGVVRMEQGRLDEAIAQFRMLLDANPENTDAWNNLGAALGEKKAYAEALKCFETALQIKPDEVSTCINAGRVLVKMGKKEEAIAQFEQAVRLAPDNSDARSELARTLAENGRITQAVSEYRELVKLAHKDASAYYNLALMLSMTGNTDEAVEQYQLALKYRPDYAEAHNNLGIALTLKQQLAQAVSHFNEALRLKPDYAEAHNNIAYALGRLGRRDEAIQHLKEALRLKPDYAQARQQLHELGVPPPE